MLEYKGENLVTNEDTKYKDRLGNDWAALDPAYVEGFVEGCLERVGEDDPEEERLFRDLWEDGSQREVVVESLKADCEVRTGRPPGHWLLCLGSGIGVCSPAR